MAQTGYQLDSVGFREHLLNSDWMVENMHSRADRAKDLFEAIAPVGEPLEGDDTPGTFKASAIVTAGTNGGIHHDRAFGRLASTDDHALSKEYGHVASNGRFVEGSHALVRSMDAFGGQYGSAHVAQTGGRGAATLKKRARAAKRRTANAERKRLKDARDKFGFDPPVLD